MKLFVKISIGFFAFSSIIASANNKNYIEALEEVIKCSALSYIGSSLYISPEFYDRIKEFEPDYRQLLKDNASNFKLASNAFSKNAELYKDRFQILNNGVYQINFDNSMYEHLMRYKKLISVDINNATSIAEDFKRCQSYEQSFAKLKKSPYDFSWKKLVLSEIHKSLNNKVVITEEQDGVFMMAALHWGHFGYVTKRDVDRALRQSK